MGVADWVSHRARITPNKDALVDRHGRLTYAELEREMQNVGTALQDLGVRPQDRVAVLMMNRMEFVVVLMACAYIGAIFVPINYRLNPDEVQFIVDDAQPELLVYEGEFEPTLAAMQPQAMKVINVDRSDHEWGSYRWMVNHEPAGQSTVLGTDVAALLYTSGTTGRPKGVMLTHDMFLWNAIEFVTDWDIMASDCSLVVNPIFHAVLNILTTPMLYKGGTVILQDKFDPEVALDWMEKERVTCMFAIPTNWLALIQSPTFLRRDLSALRFAAGGGAPVPMSVLEFFDEHGIPFREAFGLTETAPAVSTMPAGQSIRKRGSIGKPFMHMRTRIVDAQGHDVGVDEVGELIVSGPNVFHGYWNRPKASAEAIKEGWFYTGDLAREDSDGYIFIIDRKKDLIISGGENIASVELEQVLYKHPDVLEVAVIAVPDERWGEVPLAAVVKKPMATVDESGLLEYCRSQLAHFKAPRRVVFMEQLPKTATGKIQKNVLRDEFWRDQGRQVH
ncbi:MAG: o-succinylbenzoate--CoA ligase [Sulfobacillus acidophilus]|uniref:O-succinylbenzoate--CoA ligase n=1 Tax=Sulfobacillus acidophilus TaxID=53633 RepID=A0A2T2WLV5_9FIRM|nr:MAG: o-succinylbenzoate--CoA ligase [Sulfobacillus acidophilus]